MLIVLRCCRKLASALAVAAIAALLSGPALAASCKPPADFPNKPLLAALGRGVNLPGWDEAEPARRPTTAQLKALRRFDFTHIRLPVDNRRLSGPTADPGYLGAIHDEVVMLLGLGYAVSVDLHPDERVGALFAADRQQGTAYLVDIWHRLATTLRDLPSSRVAVELLNEPQIDQPTWVEVSETLRQTVRAVLPDHTIIIGPSGPQRHETLSGMPPLPDRNIVYAIHYYDPMLFSHQGATWGPPDDIFRAVESLPFPAAIGDPAITAALKTLRADGRPDAAKALSDSLADAPWDNSMIAKAFDVIRTWSRTYDRPVIINEFGVLSFAAPRRSRLRWLETVNRLARQRCLGWAHWDLKDGFGLIDPHTELPDAGIMKALRDRD